MKRKYLMIILMIVATILASSCGASKCRGKGTNQISINI